MRIIKLDNNEVVLYSTKDVCEKLNISRPFAIKLLKRGDLRGRKIGRGWWVNEESLLRFLGSLPE